MSRNPFWTVPREWAGQTCFVVAGGPSVLGQDLEALRGRRDLRLIVINSSIHTVPWADFCYFGDWRWWNEPENRAAVASFAGRVVTTSRMLPANSKVLVCRKANPPGLTRDHDALTQKWTSLTAATNLAAHLVGPGGTIVWLGADGKAAPDGRAWHHKPHRWPARAERYDRHRADIATMVGPLRDLSITLLNASPGSAYADLWPVVSLHDVLDERCAA